MVWGLTRKKIYYIRETVFTKLVKWRTVYLHYIDKRTLDRSKRWQASPKWLQNIGRLAALIILAALLFVSIYGISRYKFEMVDKVSSNQFDLTKQKILWDVFIGNSPMCDKLECHLTNDYPSEAFDRKMVLPGTEFPMKGYNSKKKDQIYYRAKIIIPESILATKESLKIYTLMVWASHFELYVNEELADTGGKGALFVTIPRKSINKDGSVNIAIKVDPRGLSYQGISNWGSLVIGAESQLAPKLKMTYDIQYVFPLWFLIPRIAFGIIFCFLFLFLSKNSEHLWFIFFASAGILKFFSMTDYGNSILPTNIDSYWAYQLVYPLEQILLLGFINRFFRKENRAFNIVFSISFLILSFISFYGFIFGADSIDRKVVDLLPRYIRGTAILYGAYLAFETTVYLAWSKKTLARRNAAAFLFILFIFMLITIAFDLLNVLPQYYRAFTNYSAELALFTVLAGVTGLDFKSLVIQRDFMGNTLTKTVGKKVTSIYIKQRGAIVADTKPVSVLFSDIRSFSTIANILSPREVVKLLNNYFELMTSIIEEHGGHIDKFIGDAIMAFWGALDADPNHAILAAKSGLEMRGALLQFNSEQRKVGDPEIAIGISINSGEVVAGEVGSKKRASYTIIGDHVNVASRLEKWNKKLQTDILISEATFEKITSLSVVEDVGQLPLENISQAVQAYKLIGLLDDQNNLVTHCEEIDKALGQRRIPGKVTLKISNLKHYDYRTFFKKVS